MPDFQRASDAAGVHERTLANFSADSEIADAVELQTEHDEESAPHSVLQAPDSTRLRNEPDTSHDFGAAHPLHELYPGHEQRAQLYSVLDQLSSAFLSFASDLQKT